MRGFPARWDLIRRPRGERAVLDDLRNLLGNLVLHHPHAFPSLADGAPALDGGELALSLEAGEAVVLGLAALAGPPPVAHRLARHGAVNSRHAPEASAESGRFPPFRRFRGANMQGLNDENMDSD